MASKISDLIKKAFEYYDNQNNNFKDFINDEFILNKEKSIVLFKNLGKEFSYQVLGSFDNNTKVWMWAWLFPSLERLKKKISEELLVYGLKLEPNEDPAEFYLKTQFVNSRFLLYDSIQLDIHLALSCYLSRNKFKFLLPTKTYLDNTDDNFITTYLLIL